MSIIELKTNGIVIYLNNLGLTELSDYNNLDQVDILFCYGNMLTEIPVCPKLRELYCSNNRLSKLPVIPTLKSLYCNNNHITEIPKDLVNLEQLKCSYNQLTKLHEYPNLEYLDCSNNAITDIPYYPKLISLICNHNQLTEIPNLPKLQNLNICINQVSEIPLFAELRQLYCGDNPNLKKIPELPNLTELYCNYISPLKVPYLKKLIWLDCDGCTYFQNAGITNLSSYKLYLKKVDVIVLLLIYSNKVKNFLSIDLIRELWNNYIF
jgi:Leucine-rich repeat (LRR) protein